MDEILKMSDVVRVTRLSRSSIYLLLRKNDFPQPKKLGKKIIFWTASDIQAWLETRPSADLRREVAK